MTSPGLVWNDRGAARRLILLALSVLVCPSPLFARTEWTAGASFENLNYLIHRSAHGINDSETLEGDFKFTYDDEKNFRAILHPTFRLDFLDFSRNRYLPNESYLVFYTPRLEVKAGLDVIRWGVSNSFNPTDLINRRDFEYNFYDPEKMGELLVSLKSTFPRVGPVDELTAHFLLLPLFQKAPLPELDTRFPIQGRANGVPYTVTDDQETPEYPEAVGAGLHLKGTLRGADLALFYYHGPERDPGYSLLIDSSGALRLEPFYYAIDAVGGNVEIPAANFLFHLESVFKSTGSNGSKQHEVAFEETDAIPNSYAQFVPGADYTFTRGLGGGEIEATVEYLIDTDQGENLRNFRPFQNDLFVGSRLRLNDRRDSKIEVAVIKDLTNREAVFLFEGSTKIYKELRTALKGVIVNRDPSHTTPLSFFDNNSHLVFKFSYSWGN